MSKDDVPEMIKDMQGRLAGHSIPPGELVFRAPSTLSTEAAPEPDLTTEAGLRQFVRAEVQAALDEMAREFQEHPALRPFPMQDEGR